jgi:hypothetical protein
MRPARNADALRANAVLNVVVRQLTALRMLLINKGIVSQEEVDYALKEIEADLAVELTLNPREVEAVERKFVERELPRILQARRPKRTRRGKMGRRRKRKKE